MKKTVAILLALFVAGGMWAQDAFTHESDHYIVTSYVSADAAADTAARLEAYAVVFNDYFHQDMASLPGKLKVKIFADKATFDTYVQRLIGETRDDYVYLHYSNPARSELAGYVDAAKTAAESGMVHQAFVQYIRAFVPNAPLWLREGFGIYFESLTYAADTGKAVMAENLSWLETYKALVKGEGTGKVFTMDELLNMSADTARAEIKTFYPQAWALVHYLAQTAERDHNRVLWDAMAAQDPAANLVDNSAKVQSQAFKWVDMTAFELAMGDYFTAKKTFPELVREGIDLYASTKTAEAQATFEKALAASTSSYVPYYYLGLISYDNGQYAKAEEYYLQALEKGANAALTNYALGVNAFADNRFEAATTYLEAALALDPAYMEKTQEIKRRMAENS